MNYMTFFISTLVVISIIYYLLLKFFCDIQKNKFVEWFYLLIVSAGIVLVNYYAFKGLSKIDKEEYSIAYPIGLTVLMFAFRSVFEYIFTSTHYFLSTKDENSEAVAHPFPSRVYKKVIESDSDKIAIYPRITIRDDELEADRKNPKHIIFDSSDFIVINKAFGAFDNLQESFSQGRKFKFKGEELLAVKVQVDFMNVYDDYSGHFGHTDVYQGKDTPYHIQIVVWAKRIKKVPAV